MKIHEILKNIRKQKGMSQEQVAEHLGVDTTNYGRIERGQSSITIDRLEVLAKLYNVPITEILNINNLTNATTKIPENNTNTTEYFINHLKEEVDFLRGLIKAKDTQIAYFIDTNKEQKIK